MTYREAIQNHIQKIEFLYDAAGSLRDYATETEKATWNAQRQLARTMSDRLEQLDNTLDQDRADMILDSYVY